MMHKDPVPRPSRVGKSQKGKSYNKKKLVVACTGCRKKKIKCSGGRPACSNCLRLSVECDYPLIKNRGSRCNYQEMMEKRLENLRRYFGSSLDAPNGTANNNNITTSMIPSVLLGTSQIASTKPRISHLSASATPFTADDIPLPTVEIVEHLVELYFKHIHCQTYSFLHKPSFMRRLRENKVNKALVLALCGLTARYSDHPQLMTEAAFTAGEEYISQAKRVIKNQIFESAPDLETVQALICLIQNDFFRSKSGKTMIWIGMLTRVAANLMLHLDRYPEKATWLEKECQRRTFWSLMVLDRLAHSSPNWTVQFCNENFADLPLPCSDAFYFSEVASITPTLSELGKDPAKDANIGLFAYHVLATLLWSDINKYTMGRKIELPWEPNSEFASLTNRLQQFYAKLPMKYKYSKSRLSQLYAINRAGQFIHLHAELLMAECVLNRSVSRHYSRDYTAPREFLAITRHSAISAANYMSDIVSDCLQTDEQITVAPFVGFAVFTISAVHVANSFADDPDLADGAKSRLAVNIRLLVHLRHYWYSVGIWCNILKDRYAKRASQQGGATGSDDAGSPPPAYLPEEFRQNTANKAGPQKPATPPNDLAFGHPPQQQQQQQQQQQPPHPVHIPQAVHAALPTPSDQRESMAMPSQMQPMVVPVYPHHPPRQQMPLVNMVPPQLSQPSTADQWFPAERRGEQELSREWDQIGSAMTEVTPQFMDMFMGLDETSRAAEQFTAEWFTDLQSLMD